MFINVTAFGVLGKVKGHTNLCVEPLCGSAAAAVRASVNLPPT